MQVGGYYQYVLIHSREVFLTKNPTNTMVGYAIVTRQHCRRVLLNVVQWIDTFVGITFARYTYPVCYYFLVYENKNNFDHRKSMMRN